jgi:hypothetical protein
MASVLMERASDLRDFVGSVVGLRDPVGVLSVTIGIEPGAGSGGTPPWEIALENDLTQLRHDGSLGPASKRRFEETSARLAELLDATSTGRGRALYVALESGASREVTLRRALPTGARVGLVAHVLPLLEALEAGERAGLIMASRDALVLWESELERASEVDRIELEPWVGDWWPEMKGPSRANPLRGQHTFSQRDRYARRIAEAYRHTLDEASVTLGALARERSWTRAVLAGDPRTIDALDGVLRHGGLTTITIAANLEGLRTEQALERLEAALETLAAQTSRDRIRVIQEEAAADAKGACGLARVLAALNDARVASLSIDPSRTYTGLVESGEILRAADPVEGTADLTDLIVSRALSTGADVIPVLGDTTERLGSCGGIAALLRW